MPLKTDVIEEPQLNMTPMIDMVFLLITFFMISWQFTKSEHAFDVKLPTAASVPALSNRPDPLNISVKSNGQVALNGKARTLAELEADLVAAKKNYAEQAVAIRADGEERYQNVVDVLAICNKAKITIISLPVRPVVQARAIKEETGR